MREAKGFISRINWVIVAFVLVVSQLAPVFVSGVANAAILPTTDSAGANDEPGQKDLTKFTFDDSSPAGQLAITWNWDDIDWSGGNTGDACALFDTDNDGKVNSALCVTVNGSPASIQSYLVYTCGDTKEDRCASKQLQAGPYASSCTTSVTATDPFASGSASPSDTTASCTIFLSDVGAGSELVNVCSYPSQQPNSDPSDCIVALPSGGTLEVVKKLNPTEDAGLFNLLIDGEIKKSAATHNDTTGAVVVSVNNHTVSETAFTGTSLAGYTTAIQCTDKKNNGVLATANTTSVSVPVAARQDVLCVITNTKLSGTITVTKVVENPYGGTTALASSFPLLVNGNVVTSGQTNTYNPGTYTVTETPQQGYEFKSFTGSCNANGVINLVANANATCIVTNTAIQPKITLIKAITGDKYGDTSTVDDFGLTIGGTAVTSGQKLGVNVGSYGINEAGKAGYQLVSVSGDAKCPSVLNGNVSVVLGDDITCTITNSAIAPKLTLKKIAINDNGGTKLSGQFKLLLGIVEFTGAASTQDPNNATKTTSEYKPAAGVGSYTLGEEPTTGYTATTWGCTGTTINGSSITVKLGDDITCTITNNDDTPMLTLIKLLGETYGSNAKVSDWTLNAAGKTLVSPTNLSGKTGSQGAKSGPNFKADTYAFGETGPGGFTAEWSCKNTKTGVSEIVPAALAISLGQSYECTATNTAIQPKLTVIKHVKNGNTGSTQKASDFTMNVYGKKVSDSSFDGSENGTTVGLDEGGYIVSEDYEAGYLPKYEGNCVGKIKVGEKKTCKVTNTAIAPKLTLKKIVINNNSGTSSSSNWTLTATPNDKESPEISGNGHTGVIYKAAKTNVTYTLSEDGPSGYTAGKWYCLGGNLKGDQLKLKLGEKVACFIVNDDVPNPAISVEKYGPATAYEGDTVNYTFIVTNTGDTPLDTITVNDNIAGKGVYQSGDTDKDGALDLSETWVYTANYIIPINAGATVVNTVTVCSSEIYNDELGDNIRLLEISDAVLVPNEETRPPVCDDDSHTLTVEKPAVLVNTGTPLVLGWVIGSVMLLGALYILLPVRRFATNATKK